MKKTYVLKNTKTNKYFTGYNASRASWTVNIFNAVQYDHQWVTDVNRATLAGDRDFGLGKNERFVSVKMVEA